MKRLQQIVSSYSASLRLRQLYPTKSRKLSQLHKRYLYPLDQYSTGLYGRAIHASKTVDYLYFCESKTRSVYNTHQGVIFIVHHPNTTCQLVLTRPEIISADPQGPGHPPYESTNKFIADPISRLTQHPPYMQGQGIACEVIMPKNSLPDSKGLLKIVELLEKINTWGVKHFLNKQRVNGPWEHRIWITQERQHSQEDETACDTDATYAHNMLVDLQHAQLSYDPLMRAIPVVNTSNQLRGYAPLFYTSKTVNRQTYHALDMLCSDYVYWVLSNESQPNVAIEQVPLSNKHDDEQQYAAITTQQQSEAGGAPYSLPNLSLFSALGHYMCNDSPIKPAVSTMRPV